MLIAILYLSGSNKIMFRLDVWQKHKKWEKDESYY
jgi:hypothetical protein